MKKISHTFESNKVNVSFINARREFREHEIFTTGDFDARKIVKQNMDRYVVDGFTPFSAELVQKICERRFMTIQEFIAHASTEKPAGKVMRRTISACKYKVWYADFTNLIFIPYECEYIGTPSNDRDIFVDFELHSNVSTMNLKRAKVEEIVRYADVVYYMTEEDFYKFSHPMSTGTESDSDVEEI